jgi:signal transduction histidine kinase
LQVRVLREPLDGAVAVALHFSDEGQGMSSDDRAQALKPFFTTRPTGTGLGLPIAQRVVEAHGGALDIESVVGRGTTVIVRLPLDDGSEAVESAPGSQPGSRSSPSLDPAA